MSVREARLFVGRILLTCGLPSGAVYGVQECVLLSQSLGLGGFRLLLEDHSALRWAAFAGVRLQEGKDGEMAVDCGGLHAWLFVPTLTDLAVDLARRHGRARMQVSNVDAAREVGVVAALAPRYGSEASVAGLRIEMSNASRPMAPAQWDPMLHAALRDGSAVDESTWRALHALSNRALAPDSVVSRRHAGPVVLADDGRLLGRVPSDDDFDINMLKKVSP
jgi:hypothetical protein